MGKARPGFASSQEETRRGSVEGADVAIALTGYFLIVTIGGGVGEAAFSGLGHPLGPTRLTLFYLCLAFLAALLSVAAVLALDGTSSTPTSVGLRGASARWLVFGAGTGLTGVVSFWILGTYARGADGARAPQQAFLEAALGGTVFQFALLVALGSVLVPVGEELIFRGVVYSWLRRWGAVLAVSASSLLFGLLHGPHPVFLAHAALMGVLLALLYEGSGSLWPGVLAHGLHNGLVFGLARSLL